jgi:hypothetical protein
LDHSANLLYGRHLGSCQEGKSSEEEGRKIEIEEWELSRQPGFMLQLLDNLIDKASCDSFCKMATSTKRNGGFKGWLGTL